MKLSGLFAAVSAKTWIHPELNAQLKAAGETFELPGECFFKDWLKITGATKSTTMCF